MRAGFLREADHRQPMARAAHMPQQIGNDGAVIMYQQQAAPWPATYQFSSVLKRFHVDVAAGKAVRNGCTAAKVTIDEKEIGCLI